LFPTKPAPPVTRITATLLACSADQLGPVVA
jgi:hypothetical protein